ncbi:MAG: glycosyltransferase family 4 protein [Parvularculaceae bacterium]|nr:glycosyltransferase family 4 protein [Parvularculaceae bacterium]
MSRTGLKIALVNTFYPPFNFGGDGMYVRRLAHALAARGCDVHIIHDAESYKVLAPKPLGDLTPLDEPPGVTVHRLDSGLGVLASLATQQTGRPLANQRRIKQILSDNFDVTHFQNVSLVGGPGILSMGSGVTLYTAHEHWLVCPTHILWRHNREICDRRECLKCQIIHRRPPQLWRYTGFLERQAAHVDAFIALSQSSADNHKRFGFPFEMQVLPSFIPAEQPGDLPMDLAHLATRPFALFVGRLEKIKGLQDLMPIFHDAPPVDLVVVGGGEYESELRAQAGDSPHIHFTGRMPPEAIGALYARCVASLLPSVCYEVFPLVALEAFRAGAPIIARNLGPFPEIIEKTGAGYLFDTASDARLALESLARDAALRHEMGEMARQSFANIWSEGPSLRAYFSLIADTAAKKGMADTAGRARGLAEQEIGGSDDA